LRVLFKDTRDHAAATINSNEHPISFISQGENPMFTTKRLFVPSMLILSSFLGVSAASAQTPGCYTIESLQGKYALIGDYGDHIAIALSTRYFDGTGNLTATFLVNEPTAGSTTGDRTIVTGTQVGTYTVNCDGTGVITTALTASNGTTATQMYDFIITEATVHRGQSTATAMVDAQQTPSAIVPGGVFLTRRYTRLPDAGGCYTLASLRGDYALIGDYGDNVAIALSTRSFDGNGNLTATFLVNEPTAGSTTGDRTIVTGTQVGTYTVNCDGTGVITTALTASTGTTAEQMYDFIITEATVDRGQPIATGMVDAQRTPSAIVPGGIFLTRKYTLRPTLPAQPTM
jgi:hypothetical protein